MYITLILLDCVLVCVCLVRLKFIIYFSEERNIRHGRYSELISIQDKHKKADLIGAFREYAKAPILCLPHFQPWLIPNHRHHIQKKTLPLPAFLAMVKFHPPKVHLTAHAMNV